MTDVAELRRAHRRENPWMTLVSSTADGLVASHYAVLLDEDRDDLTIVGHVGRPDDLIHELGEHELLVVVQGPHGYISPGWYGDAASVPTWNFVSAHLTGMPGDPHARGEPAGARPARRPLRGRGCRSPRMMWERAERSRPTSSALERGTVGFRLTPTTRRRQAQAEPEQAGRGRRDRSSRELERRRSVRESGARRRDAARARRDGSRP